LPRLMCRIPTDPPEPRSVPLNPPEARSGVSSCKWHRTFHPQLKASLPIPKQIKPYDQTPTKNPYTKTTSSEVINFKPDGCIGILLTKYWQTVLEQRFQTHD
jgi:hypothetical protein